MTIKEFLEKYLAEKYPEHKPYRYEPLFLWDYSTLLGDFHVPLESQYTEKYKKRLEIRMDAILELEKIVKERVGHER